VPKLPAFKITDLIEVLRGHYKSKSKIKKIGIRPGEKIDEWMINEDEATRAHEFKDGFVILSQISQYQKGQKFDYLKNAPKVRFSHYTSRDALVGREEARKILLANGIIK